MGSMNTERDPMVVLSPIGTQAAGITLPGCALKMHGSWIKRESQLTQAISM